MMPSKLNICPCWGLFGLCLPSFPSDDLARMANKMPFNSGKEDQYSSQLHHQEHSNKIMRRNGNHCILLGQIPPGIMCVLFWAQEAY